MSEKRKVNSRLIAAVRQGKLEETRALINSFGLNYSRQWAHGYVLLWHAVKNKHAAIAKLLLNSGAEVLSKNLNPTMTPLHFAVINTDIEIIELLLDECIDVHAKNKLGETPLHYAVKKNRKNLLAVSEILLNYGADITAKDNNGTSPLQIAIKMGSLQLVEHLLKFAEYPLLDNSKKDRYNKKRDSVSSWSTSSVREGFTSLHVAVDMGIEDAVVFLLNSGADINAIDKNNLTPLHIAIVKRHAKIVKILLQHGAKVVSESALKIALLGRECNATLETVLAYGFKLNPEDINNAKLLHVAVERGYLKIVQQLLQNGANANAVVEKEQQNELLLHDAVEKSYVECLLRKDDKILATYSDDGLSPLQRAVKFAHIEIIKLLLRYGANVNACDIYRNKVLHVTAQGSRRAYRNLEIAMGEIAQLLISNGANVDASNLEGETALHAAAENGHAHIAEILIKSGAKIHSRDKFGRTPLHIAVRYSRCKVIKVLLEYGSDINKICNNNETAIGVYHLLTVDLKFHLIKMLSAHMYVREKNVLDILEKCISSNIHELMLMRYRCSAEIAIMKGMQINNTKVTYYDILTKDTNALAAYMRNENIVQAFQVNDYKEEFPLYAPILRINFRKSLKRKRLLEKGHAVFELYLKSFSQLPQNCIDKILSYLQNKDIKNLFYVYPSLNDNYEF